MMPSVVASTIFVLRRRRPVAQHPVVADEIVVDPRGRAAAAAESGAQFDEAADRHLGAAVARRPIGREEAGRAEVGNGLVRQSPQPLRLRRAPAQRRHQRLRPRDELLIGRRRCHWGHPLPRGLIQIKAARLIMR